MRHDSRNGYRRQSERGMTPVTVTEIKSERGMTPVTVTEIKSECGMTPVTVTGIKVIAARLP